MRVTRYYAGRLVRRTKKMKDGTIKVVFGDGDKGKPVATSYVTPEEYRGNIEIRMSHRKSATSSESTRAA